MGNFSNRGGGSRFGGRPSFGGGSRFGKPSFGKKSWGDDRGGDRPAVTLYKATCAKCGAACEVPFRPIAGKPVFCKDCFSRTGGRDGAERSPDRFPKRDFSPSARPQFESGAGNGAANVAVLKQLESLNTKLDRLIQAVETLTSRKAVAAKQELGEVITAAVSKKESKKKKTAKK